jgi:excisionase family DNA binding protein
MNNYKEHPQINFSNFTEKRGRLTVVDFRKDLPLVLHVKDLSTLLSVSHNTAYELVRSGQIRSIRVGRNYRIPRDAVEEYLCRC